MNDTPNDPAPNLPVADTSAITDAELAAALRRAVQAVPDRATQARLDRRVAEFFQLSASPIRQKQFGIDGTLQTSAVVELAFSLEEREYKADFSVMDLSSAFGKVEEESGIQIHGLLGCSFMEQQKWVLDFEKLCLSIP